MPEHLPRHRRAMHVSSLFENLFNPFQIAWTNPGVSVTVIENDMSRAAKKRNLTELAAVLGHH